MNACRFFAVGFGAVSLLATAPVHATIKIPLNPVTLHASLAGKPTTQFTRDYNGYVEGDEVAALGGSILFTLDSVTNNYRTWNFTATVTNTSLAPLTSTRISGFGFSTDGTIANKGVDTEAGSFDNGVFSNDKGLNVPQLSPNVQVCFTAGNNCGGGGGGGLDMGNPKDFPSTSQVFSLTFTQSKAQLVLSHFVMRYQSIDGGGFKGDSATGVGSLPDGIDPGGDPIPEPASWAMLIAGFGLVGASLRRRRAAAA